MKLKDLLEIKNNGGSVIDALCKLEMSVSGESYTNLETNAVHEGYISYDGDLEEILNYELNVVRITFIEKNDMTYFYTSMKEINKDDEFMFIADRETNILAPMIKEPNRHGYNLKDEIFLSFEEILEVPNDIMDSCDICKAPLPRDILINIDPANNIGDIKEEYEDFDGMICERCYQNMCN